MLVVVISMRRVPVCAVEVIDVVPMRDGFMSATVTVGVIVNLGSDVSAHGVLVVVITVSVMRVSVMEVVDVTVMLHCDVAAGRPVFVVVIGMCRVGGHGVASSLLCNPIITCAYIYVNSGSAGTAIVNDNDYQ